MECFWWAICNCREKDRIEIMINSGTKLKLLDWPICVVFVLVFVSFFLCIRINFPDSLVIYVKSDKPDFVQVFFPLEGVYREGNSSRVIISDKLQNSVDILLPLSPIDRVRIDPTNQATDVFIEKIELRRLFFSEIFTQEGLFSHVKALQDIGTMELLSVGLHIQAIGSDPAVELGFGYYSGFFQLLLMAIVSFVFTVAIFLGVSMYRRLNVRIEYARFYMLVIPFLISVGVSAIFYPGFMSYDTLHALRGARNGVVDSMWPPMVSYVWRAVDAISPEPSAMHFLQVFVLLSSLFYIVLIYTNKAIFATAFIVCYLAIPVILGTIAVIWKDVLMAAFLMAGFLAIVSAEYVVKRWLAFVLLFLALVSIFLGACSRHNAITGALPLVFFLAWVVFSRLSASVFVNCAGTVILGVVLTAGVFSLKTMIDNYSLPSFERLGSSTGSFIQTVRVLDVAGASLCVGHSLFGDVAPGLTLDEIKNAYDPRHVNLSKKLLDKVGGINIDSIWKNVAFHHPICFLSNKFELTKYMIGANRGAQFIITSPSIESNEYGYVLPESAFRDSVVNYILTYSNIGFLRPWFLYCIALVVFVLTIINRKLTVSGFAIFSSGVCYLLGLVAFGNAADARLLFYTTTAVILFVFISIFELKKRPR